MAYEVTAYDYQIFTPIRYHVEELEEQLASLRHHSPVITGSLLVSYDGLPIASDLPNALEEDRAAARSASILVLAERVAQELRRGGLSQICLNGEDGHVVITTVTHDTSLAVLCTSEARIPMVLLEVQYCVDGLRGLL
jgi:predicted regulator of Ras-like GTPase activity (Roadblock/LC7/MglB family)